MPERSSPHRSAVSRDTLSTLLIPAAALVAVLPLIWNGPSCGHDFDFHILNWLEAAAQFRHGNLHPSWAVSPAWNAGEPRFLFYPPLSWTLGALLGLLLTPFRNGWSAAPILFTWICLTASGLALHRLARAFAAPTPALLAATLYLANPYMLFTAYERTAYGELLAAAWLPLLFLGILKPRPTLPAIAVPLALLWLTNAPAAVMGTYTLALLTLLRLLPTRRQDRSPSNPTNRQLALASVAGTLFGLALAAVYILPAALERKYVQIAMAVLPGMRIDDNTLFHHTGFTEDALAHDAVLHTASVLACVLLTATALILLISSLRSDRHRPVRERSAHHRPARNNSAFASLSVVPEGNLLRMQHAPAENPASPSEESAFLSVIPEGNLLLDQPQAPNPILPLTLLTTAIAFLLTPLALPIWDHAPELRFLQFPWRLLAVLAVVLALAAALALDRLTLKPLPLALLTLSLVTVLTLPAAQAFRQECDEEDTVPARQALFQTNRGTEPTDEYTPTTADNDLLPHRDPPFWLSPDPNAPPSAATNPGPAPRDFTLTSPTPQHLILNLREYPDWHITLNGHEVPSEDIRDDGLVTLPLPAGLTHVHLLFRESPLERSAPLLSISAALVLLLVHRRDSGIA